MIQLAQTWRLPDDKPVIMLPGRYVPQKGHALLLEALTEVKDIDLRCLMVGPSTDGGAYRDQLDKLVKMMGLEDRVLLADECRDMPAALMLADLVVGTIPHAFHLQPRGDRGAGARPAAGGQRLSVRARAGRRQLHGLAGAAERSRRPSPGRSATRWPCRRKSARPAPPR